MIRRADAQTRRGRRGVGRILLIFTCASALSALSAPDKARAVAARNHFIQQLSTLQTQAAQSNMPATEVAQRISALVIGWGKEARLAEPIGVWLDGPARRSILK